MIFTVAEPPPPLPPEPPLLDAFEALEPHAAVDTASTAAAVPIMMFRGRDIRGSPSRVMRPDVPAGDRRAAGGFLYRPASGSRSLEGRQASSRRSTRLSRNSAARAITATSRVPA